MNPKILITTLLIAILIALSVFSCQSNDHRNYEGGESEKAEAASQPSPVDKGIGLERKLIKTGQLEFESEDLTSTRKTVMEAINKYQAYISSDQEYQSTDRINVTMEIRVPAENFDNLIDEATRGINHFDNKTIEVQDVTEEFLDVEARLKTKKELENRYLELLKKANSVSEILEVEQHIGQLRGEIESIEGRLNYLKSRVSLSTLTLTFYQKVDTQAETGSDFKRGFQNGWDNLVLFFVLLVNIWPFLIIIVLALVGTIIWRKRKVKS